MKANTIQTPSSWAQILRQWADNRGVANLAPEGMHELADYLTALGNIHETLSGKEWNSDTLVEVVDELDNAGLTVEPYDPE